MFQENFLLILFLQTKQFGRLLAQHIVATRSKTIGFNEKKQLGSDESRLLYQKWMHTDDKKKTVEIFLNENQLNVNDFARFECGEEIQKALQFCFKLLQHHRQLNVQSNKNKRWIFCFCFLAYKQINCSFQMTSITSNPKDFEEEIKKAREYYMCKIFSLLEKTECKTIENFQMEIIQKVSHSINQLLKNFVAIVKLYMMQQKRNAAAKFVLEIIIVIAIYCSLVMQCLAELERELQSTIEHERMIGEIHENLLGKYMGGGRSVGNDMYNDLNDADNFYNPIIDERPTRDLGFNSNNRNPPYGATP